MIRIVAESADPAITTDSFVYVPQWRERYGIIAGISMSSAEFSLASEGGEQAWTGLNRRFGGHVFDSIHVARQVHSPDVAFVDRTAGLVLHPDRDGHLAATPGVLLGVIVADCIPVYLHAPGTGMIGLLHAGWRGTAGGILERALVMLEEHGTAPTHVVVHLGVGICGSCYEVGSEVFEALGLSPKPAPTPVDLRQVLADRGRAAGVAEITTSSWCSKEDERFHSFRRDAMDSGRMAAFLGVPLP